MIYIFEGINNECSVIYDSTALTQEQKERAIVLEELPKNTYKHAVLKADKAKNLVWWEETSSTNSIYSRKDFAALLLTSEELMLLEKESLVDADVNKVKFSLFNAEYIDLTDWLTIKSLEILVLKGLLSELRKNEILEGKIQETTTNM